MRREVQCKTYPFHLAHRRLSKLGHHQVPSLSLNLHCMEIISTNIDVVVTKLYCRKCGDMSWSMKLKLRVVRLQVEVLSTPSLRYPIAETCVLAAISWGMVQIFLLLLENHSESSHISSISSQLAVHDFNCAHRLSCYKRLGHISLRNRMGGTLMIIRTTDSGLPVHPKWSPSLVP